MEIACPTCGRTLRVADEHAGKQIRCPACQQISVAPGISANSAAADVAAASQSEPSATTWHVRPPEGPIYGPISWDEVLAWTAEGRITPDCELSVSAQGPWQTATCLVPNLPPMGRQPSGPPLQETPYAPQAGGYLAPHRGVLVFVMGLLGFMMTCPLFSVVAWVLGSRDLREMRSGRMDRSGEGLTLAGMILGILISVGWIVCALGLSLMVLVYVAARL
jgi:hypothetical protein